MNEVRKSMCKDLQNARTFRTSEKYEPKCMKYNLNVKETVEHLLKRCPGRSRNRRKHLGSINRASFDKICAKFPMGILGFLQDEACQMFLAVLRLLLIKKERKKERKKTGRELLPIWWEWGDHRIFVFLVINHHQPRINQKSLRQAITAIFKRLQLTELCWTFTDGLPAATNCNILLCQERNAGGFGVSGC